MNIDESYKSDLLIPLKGTVGVKITDYLSSLKNKGINIQHKNGLVDEKFIAHFELLVNKKIITNSSGRVALKSFGIEIGTNRHLIYWDCSDIMLSEEHPLNHQVTNTVNINGGFKGVFQTGVSNQILETPNESIVKWLSNNFVNVFFTVVAGVIVFLIGNWLNIKK